MIKKYLCEKYDLSDLIFIWKHLTLDEQKFEN